MRERSLTISLPTHFAKVAAEPASEVAPDSVLVLRAQADPREFAELYDRYLDLVHQYCHRRLGTREAAEDATSQVFLQVMKALPRFNCERGSFRSWLFTIAHNVVIDAYRASRTFENDESVELVIDHRASPEDLAEAADAGRALRDALSALPPRQRQVVELRLAGLSSAEIGEAIGCKPRSVDVAQHRALERLRVLMGVGAPERGCGDD